MRHTILLTGLAGLIGAVMLLAACGESDSTTSADGDDAQQIAVIAKSTVNAFWKAVEAGARDAAQDLDVEILWTGPDAETMHTQQANMVDNMVNRGVDGIVLAPTNFNALVRPVESAAQRGVPIVLIDSQLNSEAPLSIVATDNYAAGRMAGETLVDAMGDARPHGGRVIMLRFLEGSASTEAREKGFSDVIAQTPGLQLVDSAYTKGSGSTTDAADTADALLRRHMRDDTLEVAGIFASNQPTAIGMLRKIEQFQAQGKTIGVTYVGFDSHDVLLKGIRDRKIDAIIVQDPLRMGYLGVERMVKHLNGEPIDAFVDTGAHRVTIDNVDDPDIRKITLQK